MWRAETQCLQSTSPQTRLGLPLGLAWATITRTSGTLGMGSDKLARLNMTSRSLELGSPRMATTSPPPAMVAQSAFLTVTTVTRLIEINTVALSVYWPITPLVWSNDGQQILTVSDDNKVKSFAVSTGSQLAESPILDNTYSISLAGNGKFIVAVTSHSTSFLDTSTLAKIGTAIEDSKKMWSIAISLDSSRVATGREDGKIIIHNLANFFPNSYGPLHVSICLFMMLARQISITHYIRHPLTRNNNHTRNL